MGGPILEKRLAKLLHRKKEGRIRRFPGKLPYFLISLPMGEVCPQVTPNDSNLPTMQDICSSKFGFSKKVTLLSCISGPDKPHVLPIALISSFIPAGRTWSTPEGPRFGHNAGLTTIRAVRVVGSLTKRTPYAAPLTQFSTKPKQTEIRAR